MDNNNPKRNEPCHCGSGKKYKNCHNANETKKSNQWLFIILPILLLTYYLIPADKVSEKTNIKGASSNQNTNVFSQPNKTTPLGKVWSSEHNHWHDAPVNMTKNTKKPLVSPQPNKTAPPGKVWSSEHNHWHDKNSHDKNSND